MKTIIEQHYRNNYSSLLKRTSKYLHSKDSAEEVVMDAFCAALQYQDTFDEKLAPFEGWFNTILDNCIKKYLRTEYLHGMTKEEEEIDEEFEERIVDGEIKTQLLHDMRNHPYKNLLHMHLIEGYSFFETGQLTHTPVYTVIYEVNKFRQKMLNKYGQ